MKIKHPFYNQLKGSSQGLLSVLDAYDDSTEELCQAFHIERDLRSLGDAKMPRWKFYRICILLRIGDIKRRFINWQLRRVCDHLFKCSRSIHSATDTHEKIIEILQGPEPAEGQDHREEEFKD